MPLAVIRVCRRSALCCGSMAAPSADRPARAGIDDFLRHLASRGLAASTRRVRGHFLDEYLRHAEQASGTSTVTTAWLLDHDRAAAWLADAAAGKTRSRDT